MTNMSILNKVEIAFWDRAIPLMSDSPRVRRWLREILPIVQQPNRGVWIPAVLMFASGFGWGVGYLLGLMGASIR